MADQQGGRRVPNNPASYSGTGKNSRRTDQPLRSPNVQDSTDLPQGSREQILQGQRVAPLKRTPSPRVSPGGAGGGGQVSPALGPSGMEDVPAHLMDMPSTRPNEDPMAAPPDMGEPPDDVEFFLQTMVELTGDQGIKQMVEEHREFKAWRKERAQAPQPSAVRAAPLEAVPDIAPPEQPLEEPDVAEAEVAEEPSGLQLVPVSEGGEPSATSPTSDEGSMRPNAGPTPLL